MSDVPVAIVGGGPAGAATALTLARRGVPCLVVEAAPAARRKVGETIPPNAGPLLRALGIDGGLAEPRHLACHGNRYLWGRENVEEKVFLLQPHGHGWHLDRSVFEQDLCRVARSRGVGWRSGCRLRSAERTAEGWRLTVQDGGRSRRISARLVADASGRASSLARALGVARVSYDRLLGLACVFRVGGGRVDRYTHVEAAQDGWWYAALLPGDRLMVVFMTDADLLDRAMLETGTFRRAVLCTRLIGPLLGGSAASAKVEARTASSSRLRRVAGEGWLAVGDAAYAYDPVSSYGLTSALGGGFHAGNAIADHLNGRPEALPAYVSVVTQRYQVYLEMVRRQYRLERRWPASRFWRRRHHAGFAREEVQPDRSHATSVQE